jgi:hypothetical protein
MTRQLIPHDDYCRIFRTIYSVLHSENGEIPHSCIWFSLIGATILHEHYKLSAKVFMGIAAYMVDDVSLSVLTFAEKDGGRLVSTEAGFHSWIEVDGFIVDFMSPLFPTLMMKAPGSKALCKPQMLQREIETVAKSPRELAATGDFFLCPNAKLTNDLVDHFISIPSNMEILDICNSWYRRPPSEMPQTIDVSDGRGGIDKIHLQHFDVMGEW